MSFLSVLAEAFAVIACDNDDGIVVDADFLEKCNPVGHGVIGIGNFAVVQMVFVFCRERGRRFVGIVRIVQVDPHKVRSGAVFLKPGFGVLDNLHAATLDASPALFSFSLSGKVIVEIKAAIKAGRKRLAVENHGSNETCGLVAVLIKQFRGSDMLRREWNAKIGDAVHAGQESGQDRNVRSVRNRAMSECLRETNTIGGEGVECGGFDLLVPVATNMIGAQSVDRNEVHVGERGSRRGLLAGRLAGLLAPSRSAQRDDADKYQGKDDGKKKSQPSHKRSAYHSRCAELGLSTGAPVSIFA